MAVDAQTGAARHPGDPSTRTAAPHGKDLPRQRRLIWQLLNYWERRRGDRAFPSLDDIDPGEIAELWPYCFVLDVENHPHRPYFHYLGPKLARYSGIFLSGHHDWSRTLLKKAVCHYKEALTRRAPILVEEDLTQYDNKRLLFRSVLLPLSDDGVAINYLFGAANGKIQNH